MTRAWLTILPLSLLTFAGSVSAQSHPIPRTDELIDSAGYAAVLRAASAGANGKLILSLTIDSAGRLLSARPLPSKVSETLAASLADSVVAYARPQAPWKDGRWWIRLALELSPAPSLRIERASVDAPRPAGGSQPPAELIDALRSAGAADVRYRVLVDRDGTPLRVDPGSTSSPTVAAALMRSLQHDHFTPGRVDGVPERMWVELGASFRMRRM